MTTVTDAELIRMLAWTIATLLGGFATIAWWATRVLVKKLGAISKEFRDEFRGFDRRVTRIEAKVGLPTPPFEPNGVDGL